MSSLIVPRRQFLRALASVAVCAPAIVHASSLMGISARFCVSNEKVRRWTTSDDALAVLQHEMERRFAETLFGGGCLPEEAEYAIPTWNPLAAEAKITALWELRTSFGPRGSPPKPLDELPAEARAGLASIFGASTVASSGSHLAQFSGSEAPTSA
jgi:hypothetical protein